MRRHRLAEQVALRLVATEIAQVFHRFFGLDSFSDDLQIESSSQSDFRTDKFPAFYINDGLVEQRKPMRLQCKFQLHLEAQQTACVFIESRRVGLEILSPRLFRRVHARLARRTSRASSSPCSGNKLIPIEGDTFN